MNVMDAKWRQKRNHDKRHRRFVFNIGDRVMVYTKTRKVGKSEKLICNWFGPKIVTKIVTPVTYELEDVRDKKKSIAHIERIKHYFEDDLDDIEDDVWDLDDGIDPQNE